MTPKEKKELVQAQDNAVATVNGGIKKGLEEPSQREDLEIPRAKLLQSNSPEVVDDDTGTLRAGMIINSLTKEVLPEKFIPIFRFTEWIRFNPRNNEDERFDTSFQPGSLIWKSRDPNDPKVVEESQFGPKGERPLATKFMNFFSYFPGVMMPIVVSFCNTSFKAGKKLNSLCQFSQGGAIFERVYKLKSAKKENDKGKFFVYEVELFDKALEEEYKIAENWYDQFRSQLDRIQVHQESEDGEVSSEERPY